MLKAHVLLPGEWAWQLQATQCEEIRKADKEAAVRAKEAAEKIAKLPDPELEKKFETMPPTVVEVQERVKDLQTEVRFTL